MRRETWPSQSVTRSLASPEAGKGTAAIARSTYARCSRQPWGKSQIPTSHKIQGTAGMH